VLSKKGLSALFCFFLFVPVILRAGAGSSLEFPVGPANIALGETGLLALRADSVFFNPAFIYLQGSGEVTLSHLSWMEDTSQSAFAVKTKNWGLGFSYFDYGVFDATTLTPDILSQFRASDSVFLLGRNFAVGQRTAFGADVKFLQQVIGADRAAAVCFDLGFFSQTEDVFNGNKTLWSLAVRNLGGKLKFNDTNESVGQIVEGGIGLSFSNRGRTHFVLSREGAVLNLKLGLELGFSSFLKMRVGYIYPNGGYESGSSEGLRMGLGLDFGSLVFDYAVLPFSGVSYQHTASVSVRFGR